MYLLISNRVYPKEVAFFLTLDRHMYKLIKDKSAECLEAVTVSKLKLSNLFHPVLYLIL